MTYPVKVLGFGDNVVDKYEHLKMMYPGGNAVNFAVDVYKRQDKQSPEETVEVLHKRNINFDAESCGAKIDNHNLHHQRCGTENFNINTDKPS